MTAHNPHCRKNAFRWTDDAVSALKKYYVAENLSASLVAEAMSEKFNARISRHAVVGKLHLLGITRGPPLVSKKTTKPVPYLETKKRRPGPSSRKASVSPLTGQVVRAGQPKAGYMPPEPEVEGVRKVTLMMLKLGECRWPVSAGAPHYFCGLRVESGHHYCPAHREAARPKDPAKAEADIDRAAKYA